MRIRDCVEVTWKGLMLAVARCENADPALVKWLRAQTDSKCLLSFQAVNRGYMTWFHKRLENHKLLEPHMRPTPEQFEAGITDPDFVIRHAWVRRLDIEATPSQIERGKRDVDPSIREFWRERGRRLGWSEAERRSEENKR